MKRLSLLFACSLLTTFALFSPETALYGQAVEAPPKLIRENEPTEQVEYVGSPKSIGDLLQIEAQVEAVEQRMRSTVVGIRDEEGEGSGVIVSPAGLILTAGHVCLERGAVVTIILDDGREVKAETLGTCEWVDAGMLQLLGNETWPYAELGDSSAIELGQWCLIMGHPDGYVKNRPPVPRVGRVLFETPKEFQTDAPIIPGDSGGPVFDLAGKVIGIHSWISNDIDDNYHTSINAFIDNWDFMLTGSVDAPRAPGRNATDGGDVLLESAAAVRDAVVQILCDGKETVLGVVVDREGLVLTKASELVPSSSISCRVSGGASKEAIVAEVDEEYDLALLKVEASDLSPVAWGDSENMDPGQFVLSLCLHKKRPVILGTLGVIDRSVPMTGGKLGISLDRGASSPTIRETTQGGAAERAGLLTGDVLTELNGEQISTSDKVAAILKYKQAGETIELTVIRNNKTMTFNIRLSEGAQVPNKIEVEESDFDDGVSRRNTGFSNVFQHDGPIRPQQCGSLLIDLNGKAVGLNIARFSRVETFAIPSNLLVERIERLKAEYSTAP
jgi:serine protease Do